MTLDKKHIVVLGAGRSGLAAVALALREGAKVSVLDTGSPGVTFSEDVRVCEGEQAMNDREHYDLLVTSPGISLESGWAQGMVGRADEAIGETEFAARYYRGRIIGITGTNGKTTSTELIAGMLVAAGIDALPAGNHGMPLSEVVVRYPGTEAVALELSSFQLETIDRLCPEVAVWLNFAPDHLDRYPSIEAYRAAKERVFLNVGPGETVVLPPEESAMAARCGARLQTFDLEDPAADYRVEKGQVMAAGKPVLDLGDIALRGRHNHLNLLAALAAVHVFGVTPHQALDFLSNYRPPAHRFEWLRKVDGVDYINDSKCTNLHALATALKAEDAPLVLLAGGKDKGFDFSPLTGLVAERCRAVIALGECADTLVRVWGADVPVHTAATLDEAVETSRRLAREGDIVLLSPGTSSFDWFYNYEARGDSFRRLVSKLPMSVS